MKENNLKEKKWLQFFQFHGNSCEVNYYFNVINGSRRHKLSTRYGTKLNSI